MGTAHRPDPAKQIMDTPGPCMYLPRLETVKKRAANWSLTTQPRRDKSNEKTLESPGPGAYEISTYLNSSEKRGQPNTFIAGRYKEKEAFKTPSPLEYNPSVAQVRKRGPAFGIGSQPQRVPLAQRA